MVCIDSTPVDNLYFFVGGCATVWAEGTEKQSQIPWGEDDTGTETDVTDTPSSVTSLNPELGDGDGASTDQTTTAGTDAQVNVNENEHTVVTDDYDDYAGYSAILKHKHRLCSHRYTDGDHAGEFCLLPNMGVHHESIQVVSTSLEVCSIDRDDLLAVLLMCSEEPRMEFLVQLFTNCGFVQYVDCSPAIIRKSVRYSVAAAVKSLPSLTEHEQLELLELCISEIYAAVFDAFTASNKPVSSHSSGVAVVEDDAVEGSDHSDVEDIKS